jgi:hypothetical protein
MKILIKESNIKKIFTDKFGVDLTGKIKILTSTYDIPVEFDEYITSNMVRVWMNNYGPMYLIELPNETLLYQRQGKTRAYLLFNSEGESYGVGEVLDKLGLPQIDMYLDMLVNIFAEEEE